LVTELRNSISEAQPKQAKEATPQLWLRNCIACPVTNDSLVISDTRQIFLQRINQNDFTTFNLRIKTLYRKVERLGDEAVRACTKLVPMLNTGLAVGEVGGAHVLPEVGKILPQKSYVKVWIYAMIVAYTGTFDAEEN